MQIKEKIENARFLLLQEQSKFMFIGSVFSSLGLIVTLWNAVPKHILLLWFGFLTLYWLGRLYHSNYLLEQLQHRSPTVNEKRYFYLYPVVSGIFWGAAGVLFFTPDSTIHLVYLLMYLFGIVIGSAVSLSYIRWAFPIYAVISVLPISILLMGDDNESFLWIALTLLLGILAVIAISHNVYRSISDSLKIRFENEELVETLRRQTLALEEQKEVAIKANQDKSRFLASASHDLRQPIHSLSLLTDALESQITTAKGKSILGLVRNANDSLNHLLGSLLDVSKLDADVIEPQIERIDLVALLSNIADNYRLSAKQKGLQLRLHLRDCYIDSDPSLLSNAIMNLIDNAIKYTSKGGVLVSVRIHGEVVKVQVWDTGIGIEQKNHKKIYREFLQLGNHERDMDKGLGLGLSISQRVLKLLDHPLSLSSVYGRGSVFTISIPLSSLPEAPCLEPSAEMLPFSWEEARKYTVLLVDDNKTVCKAAKLALESWGYNVVTANGIEDVEQIAKNKKLASSIDVIAADYRLPNNVTGIDVIQRFEILSGYKLPAFLITGDTAPERLQEAISYGLPLLHKPLKHGEFKMVLRRLLHN